MARAGRTAPSQRDRLPRRRPRAVDGHHPGRTGLACPFARYAEDPRVGREGNRRARTGLGEGTRRQYLCTLSKLYRRAASEGYVKPGFNPAAAQFNKPVARPEEARWLEVHEAALLLEAARTYEPTATGTVPYVFPLLATYLLTGGRDAEVPGLAVDDISFDRKTVTFRPNEHRGLKTRTSHRVVPLWPQLEAILREYAFGGAGPKGMLLFPAARVDVEQPVGDVRKTLDTVAKRARWNDGEIRAKMFRHTYCAVRLQTLDNGYPVSPFTVSRELGHGSRDLVEQVYSHLGTIRHRSEEMEYRVEQHADALGDRLRGLRIATPAATS